MKESAVRPSLFPERTYVHGAATLMRRRWALALYMGCFVVALLMLVLGPNGAATSFALGIILPGAGFSSILYSLVGLGAFGLSLIIWFATGNVLLPLVMWLGLAMLATSLEPPNGIRIWVVPVVVLLALGSAWIWGRYTLKRGQMIRKAANQHLGVASLPKPIAPAEELSADDIARLRLLLDRALQPIERFDGFEWRDQFQTAAIRYQINFVSYALSVTQAQYMPAFKGYLHQAQDNLARKQEDPRVWRYWQLENMWGNLCFDADPIAHDNIMYSGFIAAQLAYWANACAYPLTDQNRGLSCANYTYDRAEITETLVRQYAKSHFGLIPCEPNWIYPLCNMITASGIRGFDTGNGTLHWDGISERFLAHLETDFTDVQGHFVPFRSAYTGLAPTGVGGVLMQSFPCLFLNTINPEMAQRHWLSLRRDMVDKNWHQAIWPVDVGNYSFSRATGYTATAAAAREMGDDEIVNLMLGYLDENCRSTTIDGVSHRENASLWAHATELIARFGCKDRLRKLTQETLRRDCAYIESATYPEVLVAKAHAQADRLNAVLYLADDTKPKTLGIAGLKPNQRYRLETFGARNFVADAAGKAIVVLTASGRTPFNITRTT